MDHWKDPLDLEIGDTIIWRGEEMRNEEGMILISPGMKGKVITRSENLLAHAARKEGGIRERVQAGGGQQGAIRKVR